MTFVKTIFATHRGQMEAAGLVRRTTPAPLPKNVAHLAPCAVQARIALQASPPVIAASPLQILFDVTLPTIEVFLIEVGEEKAEQIVSTLCSHGQSMIARHGIDGTRAHLEELFHDLLDYKTILGEDRGIDRIITAYRQADFENSPADYLKLKLGKKIQSVSVDDQGRISLKLNTATT
ncbi:MAG: hypothetical protein QME05_06615, partial [Candidatus Margulisbacteria bacterium]|nr:hypothetical protein [Candidatus Margulisiibacteriota bacterium]